MRGRASPGALQEWSCCGMLGLHEAFYQTCRALHALSAFSARFTQDLVAL